MKKSLRRVRVQSDQDLRVLLDELREDGIPRLIEENGEPVAILLAPADYQAETSVPKRRINKERIMSFAGVWSDVDAQQVIADIYRWRDEAPPSPNPSRYFNDEHTPRE